MSRDDKDGKDDRWATAGADTPGAPRDACQLHEHSQRAAAHPHLRYSDSTHTLCVSVLVNSIFMFLLDADPHDVLQVSIIEF